MCANCLFRHEAEVSSKLICSRWIFNSLLYPYSDEFISHVASKHANPGRFGPIPVRSGRFGPGRFGPISGVSRFGPTWAGRFGPLSKMGRFGPI